jgi:hypothetical protein
MKQRSALAFVLVSVAGLFAACGGGGVVTPPPVVTSVAVTCASTTLAIGKTTQCTATVQGTGNPNTAVTWSSSNAAVATVSTTGLVTGVTAGKADITATSVQTPDVTSTPVTITVVAPLSVTVSSSAATVNVGAAITLSATVMGGTGNATVAWSATAGTCSPTSGLSTTYTAPPTVPSPATVTITATATDSTGSATATASITVERVITISVAPNAPIPNDELYSDFDTTMIGEAFSCTGCETGDTLNVQSTAGGDTTTTFGPQFLNPFEVAFNFVGPGYVPGPISMWITGTDGAKSNTLWLTFDGSEDIAAEDPSSGEIYYAYSGNGTQGSFSVLKFKQDGTADGSFMDGGFGIAVDNTTHDVVFSGENGTVGADDPNGKILTGLTIPANYSSTPPDVLAVSAVGGLACATQPTIDSASCFYLPTQPQTEQPFSLPGLPSGSQPNPINVLDASHVALYGRGDQTLRWYAISGTTATAAGTLALSEFTPTDANYWRTYPATGGWDLVEVGSTLCVMGQVVNSDGTVSQKLALVNDTNQTLVQYVDLPAGTIHIAPDPTNNAIVAEYPDFTVSPPVTRFERIYVDTGNSVLLTSTSNLVPGAGFLVTNDGSHIAFFVEGKADFQPNQ